MKFYVKYEVLGFEGTQSAGPYEEGPELDAQVADIRGFEGVRRVRPEPEVPTEEKADA